MKLYKIDFTNTIGDYMITVPTDSQFLIGISNGDTSSSAQFFDGDTEILPEDSKIGEYTCFRMETQGTQFRKPYKAIISGNNFETKALWDVSFDEVDYQGYGSVGLGLPENINLEDLDYDNENRLTSFQVYVYGIIGSVITEASYHYFKTITLTWNASKMAYEVPEDFGNEVVKYIRFEDCTPNYSYYEYGWENATAGSDGSLSEDEKELMPAPVPYTQNIDLYIICQKMSVAYRDETGITTADAVQAVKESGQFLSKTKMGRFDYYVPDASIITADGKDISIIGGNFSMQTNEESGAATVLEAYPDNENEELKVYGTINGEDGLILKNATLESPTIASFLDEDGAEYTPMEITVKMNGVEKTVRAFVCQEY